MSLQMIRVSSDNFKIERCCALSTAMCKLFYAVIKILRFIIIRHVVLIMAMPVLSVILSLSFSVYFVGVSAEVNLVEGIILAQCRGSCLHVFTHPSSSSREESCRKNADCYMCWNSCRLIQGNSPSHLSLCSDNTSCFPGCKAACRFYHLSRRNNTRPPGHFPPVWSAYMEKPALSTEGLLEWRPPVWTDASKAPPPDEAIVYIVMVIIGGKWTQHIQTSSTNAIIPASIRKSKVRVIAVTSMGLAAYSEASMGELTTPANPPKRGTPRTVQERRSTSTTTSTSTAISLPASQVTSPTDTKPEQSNKESRWITQENLYSFQNLEAESQPPSVTIDRSWEVELHAKSINVLAHVEVTWEVRGSGEVDYMVTWMEASGGISGHLVSQQTTAEISLWSGQEYLIQVELLDQHGNSVLRSQPKPISFQSSSSTVMIKRLPSFSPPPPPRMTTPSTTNTPLRTTLLYPISRRGSSRVNNPIGQDLETSNTENIPRRKQYFGQHYAYSDTSTAHHPSWPPKDSDRGTLWALQNSKQSEIHQTLSNASADNQSEKETDSEGQFNSLLVWAVCLGVGAVLIVLLIILAVRTIGRGRAKKRESLSRGEDYLSETTTTTSSVNSSNAVTPQANDLNHLHHQHPPRREEQQWAYETYYGTTEQPMGVFVQPRLPPQNVQPTSSLTTFPNPHITIHNHPQHTTTRIDSASLIENYILSLDPSPIVKKLNY